MNIIYGAIITLISAIGCLGQLVSVLWPEMARKSGLIENERDVDPVFFADVRGEALWDSLILWVLPLAGILLMAGVPAWAYFGLIGGGMFLYFSGRGIVVRIVMLRSKVRIGSRKSLIGIFAGLVLWALTAILTIVLAVVPAV